MSKKMEKFQVEKLEQRFEMGMWKKTVIVQDEPPTEDLENLGHSLGFD